jgi:hypothetical protein
MAGSKTDAFEQRILDHVFKGGATPSLATPPANLWVALYTVVPSDSAAGTEVSGSGYARRSCAPADWTRTNSQIANAVDMTFPAVTGSPYTVVGWRIMDAASAGNALYWGDTATTVMNVGDIPRFATGSLTASED